MFKFYQYPLIVNYDFISLSLWNWFMMGTGIFKNIYFVWYLILFLHLCKNFFYLLSILVSWVINWMWNVMSYLYLLLAWCIYDCVLLFQWIKCVIKCNYVDIWTSSFNHYDLVFVLYFFYFLYPNNNSYHQEQTN